MAITFDAASSASAAYQNTPFTWSHTAGSGGNSMAVVWIGIFDSGATVTGVTYGGTAMTQLAGACTTNGSSRIYCYYLAGVASGAATVSVTMSEQADAIVGIGTTYFGVLQSGTIFPATHNGIDANTAYLPITTSTATETGQATVAAYFVARSPALGDTSMTDTNRANKEQAVGTTYTSLRCADNLSPANPETMTGQTVAAFTDGDAVQGQATMARSPAAGSQVIWMMAERWRGFLRDLREGTIPKQTFRQRYRDMVTI